MPETRSGLGADHSFLNLIPDELRPREGVRSVASETADHRDKQHLACVVCGVTVSYVLASPGSCHSLPQCTLGTEADITRNISRRVWKQFQGL